jgi:hypothetical protein
MKTIQILGIIALFSVVLPPGLAFSGESEDRAVEVAEGWLALVDQGEYEASWEEAAALFKSAVTVEQWQQALDGARKPFGELKSRRLKGSEYTTSMPGAPDGEYVVIQFDVSFANKAEAVETVTPMKDEDGTWRVAGYFIK